MSAGCGIPAHVPVDADERIELCETGSVSRNRGARGGCYRRSSQLELVGVLRRVHGGEPCRLHDHVAARGLDHREGGEAEDKLDRTVWVVYAAVWTVVGSRPTPWLLINRDSTR
jgi:hypothetical protein